MHGTRETDEIGIVLSDKQSQNTEIPTNTNNDEENRTESEKQREPITDVARQSAKSEIESFLPSNEIGLTNNAADYSDILNISSQSEQGNVKGSGANGQQVTFGGTRGSGRKFLYILDRSDSMSWRGGALMRNAVNDAVNSVRSLDPKKGANRFQIIVYNHNVEIFEQNQKLIEVTEANKTRAIRFLQSLVPAGGTNPEKALEAGVKMSPDVIFFLTDANEELTAQTLARIKSLRQQYKVKQICVVEFGNPSDPKKKTFRQLAGENGGSYVFRNVAE